MRNQQVPFSDAVIELRCDGFVVFGDGQLLLADKLDCTSGTTMGAQMRLNATFAIRSKRPRNLLIKVLTLTLAVTAPTKYKTAMRGFDVALDLRETTHSFSVC